MESVLPAGTSRQPHGRLRLAGAAETGTEFYLLFVIDRYSISFLKQEFCTFASNCFIFLRLFRL
jgi:hypothetical protein